MSSDVSDVDYSVIYSPVAIMSGENGTVFLQTAVIGASGVGREQRRPQGLNPELF